jgi:hypothetical protein
MSMTTVICSSGRRLNVQPCKTSPGKVQISILNANRELVASCTMDAHSADVAAKAIAMEALAADAGVNGATVEVGKVGCCDYYSHVGPCSYCDVDGCLVTCELSRGMKDMNRELHAAEAASWEGAGNGN